MFDYNLVNQPVFMPGKARCLFLTLLLCCSSLVKAQNKPQSSTKLFFEKVYLHTDRDVYIQGDTIWYKAYLVNAQNNAPIGVSGNLYVELIQRDSAKMITRQILRMDFGLGNGDIAISDSIPSGKYTLRAYTNWMRNFGDNFVFEKELTILNTTNNTPEPIVKAEKIVNKASSQLNTKFQNVVKAPLVRFFPESGSLVEGVSSLVAVKAEDKFGKGVPLSGTVINSSGDTLAHFSCDTLGMGLFAFLPLAGQKYHAEVSKQGKSYTVDIPVALSRGFALRVSHTDSVVTVVISCNDATLQEIKGKVFTLSGKHTGKICFSKSLQITDNQILINISNSLFPDGIAAIALTDDQNKPQCERLVYIRKSNNNMLTISTDKTEYHSKQKVTVHIKTNIDKVNLSMAVVDAAVVPVQYEDIQSYLSLRSELKGDIEQPNRYFDGANVNRNKQLDLLLMTQGWRDFIWRRLADTAIRISYKAEDGFSVSGKVRQKFGNKPIKDMNITLTAFKAKGQKIYSARTDSAGKYNINNLLLYGPQAVKLTARNDKGERAGWLLMDSVNTEPMAIRAKASVVLDTTSGIVKAITQRGFDRTKSNMKNGIKLKEVKIKEKKKVMLQSGVAATEFGYPDKTYNITKKDEYYESLDNWLAHNVPGIRVAPDQGVILESGGGPAMSAIIVNGREIEPPIGKWTLDYQTKANVALVMDDADKLMQQIIRQPYYDLSMDKVKSVIFRHLVGQDPDYGHTINVFLLYLALVPNALDNKDFGFEVANVDGYYNARSFYKPLYDTPRNLAKPDYRTTIHWEPNIITDANGEANVSFYNADPKTTVRVVVEGISKTGLAVAGSTTYKVN